MYTLEGKKIDRAEADRIRAENTRIIDDITNGGDISQLKNIVWTFGEKVYTAMCEKEARKNG